MAVFQRTASYATKCLKCGGDIQPGDRILWSSTDQRAKHPSCPKLEPEAGVDEGKAGKRAG
jgi:hypothetical protein